MTPRLSIVIPTYGRVESLGRLLECLAAQSVAADIEVVVVDQNAPGLLEGSLRLARRPNTVHLLQERPNASLARNVGALGSRAPLIAFMDDDLVPGPAFCADALDFLAARPEIECLVPWVRTGERETDGLAAVRPKLLGRVAGDLYRISDTISAALFMTRGAFLRSGGFDALLFDFARTAEDQEFFLRMGLKGSAVHYTPRISVIHDETQPGGCGLRTDDYWTTREKCIRSWVYRYKVHRGGPLRLSAGDLFRLSRSAFLNRAAIARGMGAMGRQVRMLARAMDDADAYLRPHHARYRDPQRIDHLSELA